ncbi:MAG: DUF1501 domain-containing protein [Acidobacteriota bacterium]
MCKTTRRGFLMGCSTAIAGLAGARFSNLAFADTNGGNNDELLVIIFLRGGMDGLNVVLPIDGSDRGFYETARPNIAVPLTGPNAALPINAQFGFHPAMSPLVNLYQDNKLSLIHAVGHDDVGRSHFDAMEQIELGTPGTVSSTTGWLTRHVQSANNLPPDIVMPSLAVGNLQPTSLLGDYDAVNMEDVGQFNLETGPYMWRDAQRLALRHLYEGDSTWLHVSGVQALDAADIIELNVAGGYTPSNGAVYPSSSFGEHLRTVAQMVKLGLGLRVATIDLGGWDTHNGQGNDGGGYFAGLLGELAAGMEAFYLDLDGSGANNYTSKMTTVVKSEFGRRLTQNADNGSDHGHGNLMMVMSGNATGGVHGTWPGLDNGQLYDGADLAVTTDFRQILAEILIRRMGNPRLGVVFPGYQGYAPLGVVSGTDLPPDYSAGQILFEDDYESGDLSAWSSAVTG